MKKKNKKQFSGTLNRIRKYFPQVTEVRDATEPVFINVTDADSTSATPMDPANCALVRACKRLHIAEGAMIGLGNSFLIKGNVATRYKTSGTVGREITAFDRHKAFAAGANYRLAAISPSERAENREPRNHGTYEGHKPPRKIHKTAFVRQLKEVLENADE